VNLLCRVPHFPSDLVVVVFNWKPPFPRTSIEFLQLNRVFLIMDFLIPFNALSENPILNS